MSQGLGTTDPKGSTALDLLVCCAPNPVILPCLLSALTKPEQVMTVETADVLAPPVLSIATNPDPDVTTETAMTAVA